MRTWFTALALSAWAGAACAQGVPPDPAVLLKAEADAMRSLDWMKGRWQGPAWSIGASGRHDIIQTERAGPFLDDTVMVVEGKSFEVDGKPAAFNAFGVMSYDAAKKAYEFHSYAQGRAGTFPLEVTPNGYAWTITQGPVRIEYKATFDGVTWTEKGQMVRPGAPPQAIFEMNLKRVGATDWPMAGQAKAPVAR